MKVIGLIGYVNKYDFAINLAKSLNIMDKSVLVVDATADCKLKYIIPALNNVGKAYVTQYNNIDFAVGFDSMYDVENYMCEQSINIALYDYIIVDIDSPKTYEYFRTRGIDKTYFFIHTDVLAIAKNKDIIKAIKVYNTDDSKTKMTKVIFKDFASRAAEDYFDKQIESYNVKWEENVYEMFLDERDKVVNTDSEFSGIIDLKKHTVPYLTTIADMTANLLGDITSKEIIKQIKRRKD